MKKYKKYYLLIIALGFSGCVEFSGNYVEPKQIETIIIPALHFEHNGKEVVRVYSE